MQRVQAPFLSLALLALASVAATALAQSDVRSPNHLAATADSSDAESDDPASAPESEPSNENAEHANDRADAAKSASTEDPWIEHDNRDYTFVGLRMRIIHIPKFMFGLFQADGGAPVTAPSIGAEYVTRRDGFEVDTWLTFTSYGMDDAPFKSSSDPDEAYEIVSSEIKTLTIGADFLWTKPLNDKGLSLVYGAGAGIGVVFGALRRNQSYPANGVPGDPEDYLACPRANYDSGNYCDTENDHYGDYEEPNWINGGSKPVLFPWIAIPQVGLRWKASRKFVMRLDTGLSLPGPFFLGVSGQYGLL